MAKRLGEQPQDIGGWDERKLSTFWKRGIKVAEKEDKKRISASDLDFPEDQYCAKKILVVFCRHWGLTRANQDQTLSTAWSWEILISGVLLSFWGEHWRKSVFSGDSWDIWFADMNRFTFLWNMFFVNAPSWPHHTGCRSPEKKTGFYTPTVLIDWLVQL